MIDKYVFKATSNEEIQKLNLEDNTKINHFHLEIDKDIDDKNFKLLWEKINKYDLYDRFHLDLRSCIMTDERAEIISDHLKKFNLKEINYNFSNTKLTDHQFDVLLSNTLPNINGLERLHLILENINLDKNKLKTIKSVLSSLNLSHIFVNIKGNKLHIEDMTDITHVLKKFHNREMHF